MWSKNHSSSTLGPLVDWSDFLAFFSVKLVTRTDYLHRVGVLMILGIFMKVVPREKEKRCFYNGGMNT